MKKNIRFNILSLVLFGIMHFGCNVYAQEVVAPPVIADVQKNLSAQVTNPVTFIGAELYAKLNADTPSQIILKKYIDDRSQPIPSNQVVVVHEREAKTIFRILNLKLDKQVKVDSLTAPSCGEFLDERKKVKVLYYSAEIELPIMPGGYDVVWMSQLEVGEENIQAEEESGLSLLLTIPDPMEIGSNSNPELDGLPQYDFCSQQKHNVQLSAQDPDGDEVIYSIFEPSSYWSYGENNPSYSDIMNGANLEEIGEKIKLLPKKILLRKPPFKRIAEMDMLSITIMDTGGMDNLSIDEDLDALNFNAEILNKNLIGINIAEKRNGKTISEHQAVFLIYIQ